MKIKILLLSALVIACSSGKDEKLYDKSVETHELAMKIGSHVSEKIDRIAVFASELEEPLKSLMQDSVVVLKEDYALWQSTIVEVPGHEHDHHDHDGHDHSHEPSPDLTPEMVLDIQKDLRDRAVQLNIRAQQLLDILKKNGNE